MAAKSEETVATRLGKLGSADKSVSTYPRVVVFWRDAWSDYEKPEATECVQETLGFLVEKNRHIVRVAQTRDDFSACDVLSIPRAMVKSIKKVKIV